MIVDAKAAGTSPEVEILALKFQHSSRAEHTKFALLKRENAFVHQVDPIELVPGKYQIDIRGFSVDGVLLTQSETSIDVRRGDWVLVDAGGES